MAITVLDTPTLFLGATSGSYTVPAGSNRLALLFACGKAAGDYTLTARDAGGQTPTAIDRSRNTSGSYYIIDVSYLTEAQIVAGSLGSAHTFSTTWSTTPGANVFLAVMTLAGVHQSSPVTMTHLNVDGTTFKNYPGQSVTCTLGTNVADGLILIACHGGWVAAMTNTPSGFTLGYNDAPSGNSAFGIGYIAATGSSQAGTWGKPENSTVSAFGIAFAPASGATGGGPLLGNILTRSPLVEGRLFV